MNNVQVTPCLRNELCSRGQLNLVRRSGIVFNLALCPDKPSPPPPRLSPPNRSDATLCAR